MAEEALCSQLAEGALPGALGRAASCLDGGGGGGGNGSGGGGGGRVATEGEVEEAAPAGDAEAVAIFGRVLQLCHGPPPTARISLTAACARLLAPLTSGGGGAYSWLRWGQVSE